MQQQAGKENVKNHNYKQEYWMRYEAKSMHMTHH